MADVESRCWLFSLRDQGRQLSLALVETVAATCEGRLAPSRRRRHSSRNTQPESACRRRASKARLPSTAVRPPHLAAFGSGPIALTDLATLLQLTWGVHGWIQVPGVGPHALKTSPSGGARHSIEVYVLARKVASLARGLYHYQPDTHRLARIGRRGARQVSEYLPGQHWYNDASAVLLMTAVFDRVQWRYPYARAYRAVLAESGHLCQTFCLVATWLGLAPFCTMALADSRIERDLKIDGVSESVIYAAGVGPRPKGVDWAPWPGSDQTPVLTPPAHAGRRAVSRARRQPSQDR